ncbi:MAG TPA: acetyl-CoA C-acyltransferase [Thermosulfidibacter takaii]|uniref:acetyl-CoA C-acyltransferase n=1 Tax=Thermosulfidibacter takaii TaxID=412593 RepID=A0A7C0U637_9BACT|nr:acetyl-CoA C-acyltransferase [Thermosulfidibacter takaii]
MREAVIVAAARTAVGKAPRGTLKDTRPDEMAAVAIAEAVKRAGIEPGQVDDVILGCAFPEGEQGMNVARVALTRAGLPSSVPGMTINRFCSSGLQAIAIACEKVMCGFADIVVAGGTESMSMIPMGGLKQAPNPHVIETYPQLYMAMGLTAEEVAKRWKVSREDQDAFALASHQKAAAAIEEGRFKDEIVPLKTWVRREFPDGSQKIEEVVFEVDEGVRPDTTMEALSKLRPAFALKGTVTAGNSSQMSDGAAAVVVMSDKKAAELGVKPLAVFRGYAVGGVDPDIMGIGPTVAIPKVMKITGLKIEDMDLIELNEAFAAQSLACIRILGMEDIMERINVNGGAIALGHPLGCTGAKLTVTILYEMARRNAKYGLVSMCIGGGMGAAGIFERV